MKQRKAANRLSKQLLQEARRSGRQVEDKDIFRVLKRWGFDRNTGRRNVTPLGRTYVESDTLGLVCKRCTGEMVIGRATRTHGDFAALICQWLKDSLPKGIKFPFSSITLNHGTSTTYPSKRHRDTNNMGPSLIKTLGRFSGGRLECWPDDDLSCQDVIDLPESGKVKLDVKGAAHFFNGCQAHGVERFRGERFAVIAFSDRRFDKADLQTKQGLRKAGFSYPNKRTIRIAWEFCERSSGAKNVFWHSAKRRWLVFSGNDYVGSIGAGSSGQQKEQSRAKAVQLKRKADLERHRTGGLSVARGRSKGRLSKLARGIYWHENNRLWMVFLGDTYLGSVNAGSTRAEKTHAHVEAVELRRTAELEKQRSGQVIQQTKYGHHPSHSQGIYWLKKKTTWVVYYRDCYLGCRKSLRGARRLRKDAEEGHAQ